jgi:hypothetical protein
MSATADSATMSAKGISDRYFSRANDRRRGGFVESQGGGTILLARRNFARHVVSVKELAFAPLYAIMKVPMYLRFFYDKQVDWVRSARKGP